MTTVQSVPISAIDRDSTVNVRRHGVEDNVEKVKTSIREHGYWPDMPIVLRPHPDPSSQYEYEHVTGQCRFRACVDLGLAEIPAFVFDLSDEEAIQRSWLENEARGDLTYSDRAYWTERIFKSYAGQGHTASEALQKAADYLGVGVQTVMRYYALVILPDELQVQVDQGILPVNIAVPLVRNAYDLSQPEKSAEKMKERASWILGLDQDARRHAVRAMESKGHNASIEDLEEYVTASERADRRIVRYAIPEQLHSNLLKWGAGRGLKDETQIVGQMVTEALIRQDG